MEQECGYSTGGCGTGYDQEDYDDYMTESVGTEDYCTVYSYALGCTGNEEQPGEIENNVNRDTDTDADNNGYPDVPDPFAGSIPMGTHSDPSCSPDNLVECFYSRGRLPSGDWSITQAQLDQLMAAVYFDIHNRPWTPIDFWRRDRYDTPFWDGYHTDTGNICVDGVCYDRNEVNYLAQGMYSAKYEQEFGRWIVNQWNERQYGHPASQGELFWWEQGFEFYHDQAWYNYAKPSHIK